MDLRTKIIEKLQQIDLKYKETAEKIQCQCISPNHKDKTPSAFFHIEKQFYHCSSCGYSLDTPKLIEFLGGKISAADLKRAKYLRKKKLREKSKEIEEEKTIILPRKWDKYEIADILPNGYRQIRLETFQEIGAYFTKPNAFYGMRIVVPLYNIWNELKGFEAFAIKSQKLSKQDQEHLDTIFKSKDWRVLNDKVKVLRMKDMETTTMFGLENKIKQGTRTITLHEGIWGALSFYQEGVPAVYNFGTQGVEDKINVLKIKGIKNVTVVQDYDDAGKYWVFGNKDKNKIGIKWILSKNGLNCDYWRWKYNTSEKSDGNDLLSWGIDTFKKAVKYNLENKRR